LQLTLYLVVGGLLAPPASF